MMMVSDDCLVECNIDDDSDEDEGGEEQMNTPPPPPEFASKAPTLAPRPPTPVPRPLTPPPKTPTPSTASPTPTPTCPVSRDPYGINQHLKVEVSDVLAEPATPRSIDIVWLYSVVGFERARFWTYRCLSLLLAVPFAFLCGVFLAVLACLHVCIRIHQTSIVLVARDHQKPYATNTQCSSLGDKRNDEIAEVCGALHTAEQHLPSMPAVLVFVHCQCFHRSLLFLSRSLLQSDRRYTVEQGLASAQRQRGCMNVRHME
ncbi:Caveolin-2 [Collichthys lucidus]|uniref:Caveolin-2 n=1 Tax=Collichthys lucidus TaxID=240159 RepID=A0A4V6AQV0_COLLU|nr:Caveolin-2 [Collichthys lucidus]